MSKKIGSVAPDEVRELMVYYDILTRKERRDYKRIVSAEIGKLLVEYREFITQGMSPEGTWLDAAACRKAANIFDEPDSDTPAAAKTLQTRYAREICSSCHVRAECLDDAIRDASATPRSEYGVYGVRAGVRLRSAKRAQSFKDAS